MEGENRSLNTVAGIAADPDLLQGAAIKLMALAGMPARMGAQLNSLFVMEDKNLVLSREGASVLSSVQPTWPSSIPSQWHVHSQKAPSISPIFASRELPSIYRYRPTISTQ